MTEILIEEYAINGTTYEICERGIGDYYLWMHNNRSDCELKAAPAPKTVGEARNIVYQFAHSQLRAELAGYRDAVAIAERALNKLEDSKQGLEKFKS